MAGFVVAKPGFSEAPKCEREGAADAGAALRRAREASGFTLRDVSAGTRITERYLVALERSEFHVFPAAIYAVGFAKIFARHVGISEAWIAEAVRSQLASPGPELSGVASARGRNRPG